ncbi:MAG: type II toxin-antitoxin system VapC family toxin [Chloroflexi bacterium]|nr:type II toxin-antitoxin system VapC family toxin [Chloroflexota bacterium]
MTAEIPEALLDTDTLSLYARRHPQVRVNAAAYLRAHGAFTLSELTRYEITRGLQLIGANVRLAAFERLCRLSRILPFDEVCARHAAQVWVDLHRRGRLIGEVDTLIAGTALAHNLAVVSRNTAHFSRVPGLVVVDWTREREAGP